MKMDDGEFLMLGDFDDEESELSVKDLCKEVTRNIADAKNNKHNISFILNAITAYMELCDMCHDLNDEESWSQIITIDHTLPDEWLLWGRFYDNYSKLLCSELDHR